MELLLRAIAGEPVPERTPLLPVELIVRGSCGGSRRPDAAAGSAGTARTLEETQ